MEEESTTGLLSNAERRAIYRSLSLERCELMDLFLDLFEKVSDGAKFGGVIEILCYQQQHIPQHRVVAA